MSLTDNAPADWELLHCPGEKEKWEKKLGERLKHQRRGKTQQTKMYDVKPNTAFEKS